MTGRAEVDRLKQRLDATFARAGNAALDAELLSDVSRYLCVLVAGYVEKALAELLLEHTRRHAGPSLQRFVEYRTRRITNINAQYLQEVMGTFDGDWRRNLEEFVVDEKKAALDSIVSLRNAIAHGESVGVTYSRVQDYYKKIQLIVDRVANLCVPM